MQLRSMHVAVHTLFFNKEKTITTYTGIIRDKRVFQWLEIYWENKVQAHTQVLWSPCGES